MDRKVVFVVNLCHLSTLRLAGGGYFLNNQACHACDEFAGTKSTTFLKVYPTSTCLGAPCGLRLGNKGLIRRGMGYVQVDYIGPTQVLQGKYWVMLGNTYRGPMKAATAHVIWVMLWPKE